MTIGINETLGSFMTGCVLKKRAADDVMVCVRENGDIAVRLDRYAIIPLEEYEALLPAKDEQKETPNV